MTKQVYKFGGSSLSSAKRYHAVANICHHLKGGDAVVVSAAGKTTDTLVRLWSCYHNQDHKGVGEVIALLKDHQCALIAELLGDKSEVYAHFIDDINAISQRAGCAELEQAWLLAHGELWSARLLAHYLNKIEVAACHFDSRDLFIVAQNNLKHEENTARCQVLKNDQLNVVTGFIASDENGSTVTLGRNGSDYSATLLGKYLNADSVTIWTDTQGVYSTDPRKVEKAVKYNKISQQQAQLLARLGNPVLHAKTLTPLKDSDIKLVVRSSYDSHSDGTKVVANEQAKAKRFLTTLASSDVFQLTNSNKESIRELSILLQHPLQPLEVDGNTLLLVPSQFGEQVAAFYQEHAVLIESNVSGVAIVSEPGSEPQLLKSAKQLLEKQSMTLRGAWSQDGFAILLGDQLLESDTLSLLHDELISAKQELAVIVAGIGNVGEVFLSQLNSQLERLNTLLPVKLVGLLRSTSSLLNGQGIALSSASEQFNEHAKTTTSEQLIEFIKELDYGHKVIIDITASEQFSLLYPEFALHDCHIISANKYAGTAELDWYENLRRLQTEKGLLWRYNTSVGAGLPINFALKDLQNSGDKITKISGVFSGTLSWLGAHYSLDKKFSELVEQARELGFTEPDPREDLSGRDVQRKLLILARELGLSLNLDDIELSAWMPTELANGTWQDALTKRDLLDKFVEELALEAEKNGKTLRYVAELDTTTKPVIAKVGLKAVSPNAAVATLTPGDNIFVINSVWYENNALIIQGPGAGREVTAAGVHSDLYWLCHKLSE
ncbi:bifunctional aspartate kinase/homoserine dehydrogenase II [Pseudoalteromonas piratica]|uniref:Aspartate kinase n=1 Tax=Pseudoalteromonas piratica TaxID=1348114 RepID=A0A0A7EBM3_9GAMM|nr:bifunctional aspartate kinase/homoserine dehydrogenase II [Pseudoalteromonas piratica]AIY63969.1 aspartate kinase [Pseudoalteromonas piratica]